MEIIKTKAQMKKRIKEIRKNGKTIGFVPTMGYLHDGHLALATSSVRDNDITVMSIFVNPLQFGPNEDFDTYPRDPERDEALAKKVGVDILFMPDQSDMYDSEPLLKVEVLKRTNVLCGKSRPGHFDGVATVLMKLFNIVQPDRVYMGLKDAQQVAVVDSLIHYFDYPIELVPVPTVREEDGLAKSSRNVYLSVKERAQAPYLYKALKFGEQLILEGERNPQTIVKKIEEFILQNTDGIIDYIEILSFPELSEIKTVDGKIIIAIAVKFSKARLIDNIILDVEY